MEMATWKVEYVSGSQREKLRKRTLWVLFLWHNNTRIIEKIMYNNTKYKIQQRDIALGWRAGRWTGALAS